MRFANENGFCELNPFPKVEVDVMEGFGTG